MSWWLDAAYVKPNSTLDLFNDCDFDVDRSCAYYPLAESGKKRKLDAQMNGISMWESKDYQQFIRHMKETYARPTIPVKGIGTAGLSVTLVDICESLVPASAYPVEVIRKYQKANLPPNTPLPLIVLYGSVIGSLDNNGSRGTLDLGEPGSCSICLYIYDVFPYLVVECPVEQQDKADTLRHVMEKALIQEIGSIAAVEVVRGETLMEFDHKHPKVFFKITCFTSKALNSCRSVFEKQYKLTTDAGGAVVFRPAVYECTVPLTLRWMIDKGIVGFGYIECRNIRLAQSSRKSRCTVEGICLSADISAPTTASEQYDIIPNGLRILAIDIECIGEVGFPRPETDPVIQISCILTHFDGTIIFQCVLTLDKCAPLDQGALIISFKDERSLLHCWRDLVNVLDPDVLTGYNHINFDLVYLIKRSSVLDVPTMRNFGRALGQEQKLSNASNLSSNFNPTLTVDGRILFDVYDIIKKEYRLKSYSLNNVCSAFLQMQKEDVHYSQLKVLQMGNEETRKRIASYCLKDSFLVIQLLNKLSLMVNIIEMARVTGVNVNLLLSRGQQIKVTSQLLRKCKTFKYFMPAIRRSAGPNTTDIQYEGATVLDPIRGFYSEPIATLDFASLYPSIMIAQNLCYSTLVLDPSAQNLKEHEDYEVSPAKKCFVKKHVRQGVLPTVVADLLAARKQAKMDLKRCTDPFKAKVLDARQLALKLSANSVYGYTGAVATGQLPCLAISESITAYGREMIEFTKTQIELLFKKDVGFTHDATVVYGDTDSVMVKFGEGLSLPKVMTLGLTASKLITQKFIPPISLEFEKVFCPFLLMNKKRYAGVKWTQANVPKALLEAAEKGEIPQENKNPTGRIGYIGCPKPPIDCKGIETVRRDFCLLIQQVTDDVLNRLLLDQDIDGAVQLTRNTIQNLLMNKVDMSYLVMSKSIGKEEYSGKLAHIELAKKMKERDPQNAPGIGDRVYYVVVAGYKNQPQYERAEDPLYALEHNIPLDMEFYLDTLKNVLMRVFEGININTSTIFATSNFVQKKLTVNTKGQDGSLGLGAFVKKGIRCLLCKAVIEKGCFCHRCRDKDTDNAHSLGRIVHDITTDYQEKAREHTRLWTQCQACQGSVLKDVICVNRDCPIFYMRIKIKKDLQELVQGSLKRVKDEDPLDW